MTYVCAECGAVFEQPQTVVERHGLDTPPYEEFRACPACRAYAIVEGFQCDCCREYITGRHAETEDGRLYCPDCFTVKNLLE